MNYLTSFALAKKQAIKAAKELGYDEEVVKKLQNAENEHIIEQIMHSARNRKDD